MYELTVASQSGSAVSSTAEWAIWVILDVVVVEKERAVYRGTLSVGLKNF